MAVHDDSLTAREAPIRSFSELRRNDVAFAGGKGANLGELTSAGLPVPDGFVVGAPAYAAFTEHGGLRAQLESILSGVASSGDAALNAAAAAAQAAILSEPFPEALEQEVRTAYAGLGADVPVAVRSSATAEDTAAASFAGMNESFLDVVGSDDVLDAVRRCWASLFGARTIAYRAERGLPQAEMDIAVVVQRLVASTRAGVMFTVDPATGAPDRLVIEGAFGLGESVVKGEVTPDRFVVDKQSLAIVEREIHDKSIAIEPVAGGGTVTREVGGAEARRPVLNDDELREVAQLGCLIEDHYDMPQDTEWAVDEDGAIWILQARPVTTGPAAAARPAAAAAAAAVIVRGRGASPGIAGGRARVVHDLEDGATVERGDVLVAHMTSPDWVPVMRRAAAIVTDLGGVTCHAAIVSRELAVPCVVGTSDGTSVIEDGQEVTVDGALGEVRPGRPVAPPPAEASLPRSTAAGIVTATQILVNLSEPSQVDRVAALDVDGVGLLRAELMVLEALDGMHPRLLLERGRGEEFVERMAAGLTTFARGFAPRPITYRTIDFRTNEFRGLEGGSRFEPEEANPMIGYRGAARYVQEPDLFRLELAAVARVWDAGFQNLHVMLPFVRTPGEVETCQTVFRDVGLLGRRGFELWLMAEVPSILFRLPDYARLGVAGISIGSNDLTQLVLGVDRDSGTLTARYDERDPAVVAAIAQLVRDARGLGLRSSICGQAPSVHAAYPDMLVRAGIDAISVSADAVERVRRVVASAEQRLVLAAARR